VSRLTLKCCWKLRKCPDAVLTGQHAMPERRYSCVVSQHDSVQLGGRWCLVLLVIHKLHSAGSKCSGSQVNLLPTNKDS